MTYSGGGTVSAPVVPVDVISDAATPPTAAARRTPGGAPENDFARFPAGSIALVQRGLCPFDEKARNAQAAGAAAVIIFNQGDTAEAERTGVLLGTLAEDSDVTVPVLGATYAKTPAQAPGVRWHRRAAVRPVLPPGL